MASNEKIQTIRQYIRVFSKSPDVCSICKINKYEI